MDFLCKSVSRSSVQQPSKVLVLLFLLGLCGETSSPGTVFPSEKPRCSLKNRWMEHKLTNEYARYFKRLPVLDPRMQLPL